jgi:hypothetical protein
MLCTFFVLQIQKLAWPPAHRCVSSVFRWSVCNRRASWWLSVPYPVFRNRAVTRLVTHCTCVPVVRITIFGVFLSLFNYFHDNFTWCRIVPEKLILPSARHILTFVEHGRSVTVFRGARHWSPSLASWIQSTAPHPPYHGQNTSPKCTDCLLSVALMTVLCIGRLLFSVYYCRRYVLEYRF